MRLINANPSHSISQGEEGEEERELLERELAISYLKNKLGKYQQTRDQLAQEVTFLVTELEREKTDHRAIIDLLTGQVKASNLRMEAMQADRDRLQAQLDDLLETQEARFEALRSEKDKRISDLEEVVLDQGYKLKELEEFTRQKDSLQAQLLAEKEQRAEDERKWREDAATAERHFVQEKDRWQKELQHQIKETKAQMMKLMDNQLDITTKRTIMENEQMHAELAYQSRQSEKIADRSKHIFAENAELRRQVELAKQTETELAKRGFVYQKTIKMLLTKAQEEAGLRDDATANDKNLKAHINVLESRIDAMALGYKEAEYELSKSRDLARAAADELEAWRERQSAAAMYLMQCMEDVAAMRPETVEEGTMQLVDRAKACWGGMSAEDRTRLLRKLLLAFQVTHEGGGGMGSKGDRVPGGQVDRLVLPPIGGGASDPRPSTAESAGLGGTTGTSRGGKRSSKGGGGGRAVPITSQKWKKGERGSEALYDTVPGVGALLEAVTLGKADKAVVSMRRSSRALAVPKELK